MFRLLGAVFLIMALRTLNFGEYLHGTLEERFNFGITLVQSFKEYGFVKLTNHGISEEIIEEYLEMVRSTYTHGFGGLRLIQFTDCSILQIAPSY